MISSTRIAALTAILCAASLSSAQAADAFYVAPWTMTEIAEAPWAKSDAGLDQNEMRTLVGKTIALKADAVDGPGSFPCKGPQYEVLEGGPDMLFQGMFGQMHDENASADPQKLAEQVGFAGTKY